MIRFAVDRVVRTDREDGVWVDLYGWAFAEGRNVLLVEVWLDGRPLGRVPYGFDRPDVRSHFSLPSRQGATGFGVQLRLPQAAGGDASRRIRLSFTASDFETAGTEVAVPPRPTAPPGDEPRQGVFEPQPASSPSLAEPTLFVLGAGKCGTTSLHHALAQHPAVLMSDPKEPTFFSDAFQVVRDPVAYFALFPRREGTVHYGESSHHYFSAPEAAPWLAHLFPAARYLLIVRNPVHRAHSLYHHMVRNGNETLPTFEEALAAEDGRFDSDAFRRECRRSFWNYMYVRSSRYDDLLAHALRFLPLDRFLFLTLGEWQSDPGLWCRRIFRFLGVDDAVAVDATPRNQARTAYAPLSGATREALEERFRGVRERYEALAGRRFDAWET